MRGIAWDLKRRYATALLAGSSEKDQLLELIKRHNGWNFARELWDFTYALDLPDANATFTRTSPVNVWGYDGVDPGELSPPTLITVPAEVQAIQGGIWDGSAFSTKASDGADIHPMLKKETPLGVQRIPIAFQSRADNTVYAKGNNMAVLSQAGNYLWAKCVNGGTSDVGVHYLEDDIGSIVVDGTAQFLVEGYATLHKGGLVLEAATTNYLLNSEAPATQTTASLGTGFYTVSVYGSGSIDTTAGTATIVGGGTATEGTDDTFEVTVAGTVTVTLTGALDYFQLEAGTFATSLITTTSGIVTRAATLLSDNTAGRLTATGGAGRIVVSPDGLQQGTSFLLASYIDADNITQLLITDLLVRFYKVIAGDGTKFATFNFVYSLEPFVVEFYYDSAGSWCRAYNVGDSVPAWATVAHAGDAQIAATFELLSRNSSSRFCAGLLSCEISTNKEDFGW